jgi:peptide/nickel transport system substrate-binding protein
MKNPKFVFAILAVLLVSITLVTSCASSTTSTSPATSTSPTTSTSTTTSVTPKSGGTLRILSTASPAATFGWPAQLRGADVVNAQPCYEALLRQLKDGTFEPWLATNWTLAPDQKSVTLTLRKGVKFQDGTDFNATAAKWNIDQLIAGKVPGSQNWSSAQVIDDYTIKIGLNKFSNYTWCDLASNYAWMASPTAFNVHGLDWMLTNPVGTGPFACVSFQSGTSLEYKRFDEYWGGKPLLDGVKYLYIKDPVAQEAMLETGEADMMITQSAKIMADMQAKGIVVNFVPDGCVALFPDSANPGSPFSDLRVRQALSCAIDRNALMKISGYGFLQPAYQLPIPGIVGFVPSLQDKPEFDPDKAKALLTEAGYADGFSTKIIPMPGVVDNDIMVAVQAYFKNIGIQADVTTLTMGAYTEYRMNGWTNALMGQPMVSFPNFANTPASFFLSPQFPSTARPAGLNDLVEAAFATPQEERSKVEPLTSLIADDVTVIPVYYLGTSYIATKAVHDLNRGTYAYGGGAVCNWEKVWLSP